MTHLGAFELTEQGVMLVCVFPGSLDAWIGFVQMVLLAVGAGLLLRSMYPGAREEAPLLG